MVLGLMAELMLDKYLDAFSGGILPYELEIGFKPENVRLERPKPAKDAESF